MNILHRIMERKYRERIHEVEKDITTGRIDPEEVEERLEHLDGRYLKVNPHQRHSVYYQTHLNFYHEKEKSK